MKFKKVVITSLLSGVMMTSMPIYAANTDTKDVANDFWAKKQISWTYNKNYLSGYPDGTFKPQENMTNAEFISLVIRILSNDTKLDVNKASEKMWYSKFLTKAEELGLISSAANIDPNAKITRDEAFRLLAFAYSVKGNIATLDQFTDKDLVKNKEAAAGLLEKKVVTGYPDKTLKPNNLITRAEVANLVYIGEEVAKLSKIDINKPLEKTKTTEEKPKANTSIYSIPIKEAEKSSSSGRNYFNNYFWNPSEEKTNEKPSKDKKEKETEKEKPSEDKKEEETVPEKTQEEKIKEEIEKVLKDEDLSEQIKESLNNNRTEFEKLFDFRTEDEKKVDKFVDELIKSIKDQNKSNEILNLLEKDRDIFNKLVGKEDKKETPTPEDKEEENPAEDEKEKEKPAEDKKEEESTPEKTQEEKIKKELEKILKDEDLSNQIKESLNKNQTEFEKLFDFRTEDEKKVDKFVDELIKSIKDQNKSNEILNLLEKDRDIFNKLVGKEDKKEEKPAEDKKEEVTEADIDAYIAEMEKGNDILPIKDRDKSKTGPILERTEYKDVKIRDKNGNITTVRVKYLTGLSEESWKIVNEYRKKNGLPEIQAPSRTLQEAANIRVAELYYNYKTYGESNPNHFAHVRTDGRDIENSMNNFGGENILHGKNFNLNDDYDAARQTFEVFRNSPGHDENMRWDNPNKKPIAQERRLAIATVVSEEDPNLVFQVQLYGSSIWGDENHSLLNAGEKIKYNDNSVEPIYNKDGSEEYARQKHEENKRKGVRQFLETGQWPEVKSKTENEVDKAKEEFNRQEEERKKAAEKAKEEKEKKTNDAKKEAEDEYAKKQRELAEQLAREEEENRKRIQDEVGTDPSKGNNNP
ncbi:MAG: S-layer homology domain-containing protein [Peptoniphilus harei]|uniref:CAP and S-layer homology domain-containing protein n=3 Tax=Peptoniphilus harei TaxID=54005 RepID=UPI00290008E5|nr:S-layer homology domain-containing protein [Peptoniphilus harei]MDU3086863.1 S-layer homology domain-containing protein [Peptoniphilus harei]